MNAHRPDPVRLVLASASERRRHILAEAGYRFDVCDPGEAECAVTAAPGPEALAIAKARAKAQAVARGLEQGLPALVIGADTLVALGEEVLGKPLDRADACRILVRLSGTRHRVITGLCLWLAPRSPRPVLAAAASWVTMKPLNRAQIEAYVDSGEADGKAGAYAIQESGDRFVERVEGSLRNVAGFPLELFEQRLSGALRNWSLSEKIIRNTIKPLRSY